MENQDNYLKSMGLAIKHIRENSNISISNMAEALNVSESYISHLEYTYNNKVSLLRYYLMAEILKVDLSYILNIVSNDNYPDSVNFEDNNYYFKDRKSNITPDTFVSYICNELKEERISKGVTQNSIAKQLSITRRYYGAIENGEKKTISLYRLLEVTEVIGTPLYVLVERAERLLIEIDKGHK